MKHEDIDDKRAKRNEYMRQFRAGFRRRRGPSLCPECHQPLNLSGAWTPFCSEDCFNADFWRWKKKNFRELSHAEYSFRARTQVEQLTKRFGKGYFGSTVHKSRNDDK